MQKVPQTQGKEPLAKKQTATHENAETKYYWLRAIVEGSPIWCSVRGELNLEKSFTFGDECVNGVLGDDVKHLREFRVVGGS